MSSIEKKKRPFIEIASKVGEINDPIKTDCLVSKNVVDDLVTETCNQSELKDPSKTPSKSRTSSHLLYSEFVESEKTGMFENKKTKPMIQPYGESPLYKKYSALLKELQESKDECQTECEKESPVVEIHCLLKQKTEDNSDDSDCDIEDSRLIFYDSKNETRSESSDEETSSEDEETVT